MRYDHTSRCYTHHLVAFGAYLPFYSLLRPFLDFLEIPMSDFSPGENMTPVLSSHDISAGVSICYEDTFGREVMQALPAANVLVNISNDAWFGDSIAPHQHLQMARFRALEAGRYMLRSTNTGITASIELCQDRPRVGRGRQSPCGDAGNPATGGVGAGKLK